MRLAPLLAASLALGCSARSAPSTNAAVPGQDARPAGAPTHAAPAYYQPPAPMRLAPVVVTVP